jgi:hypothetical protein
MRALDQDARRQAERRQARAVSSRMSNRSVGTTGVSPPTSALNLDKIASLIDERMIWNSGIRRVRAASWRATNGASDYCGTALTVGGRARPSLLKASLPIIHRRSVVGLAPVTGSLAYLSRGARDNPAFVE